MIIQKSHKTRHKGPILLPFLMAVAMAAIIFAPTYSISQNSPPPVVEVTNEEDIRFLKALDHEAQRLVKERNACKATAQDYKQECLCDKHKEYLQFYKKTDEIMLNSSRMNWVWAILSYEDGGQTKRTSLQRFSQINLDFEMSCFRNDDGIFRANHEWDKPELLIKDPEIVKTLVNLFRFKKKMDLAIHECASKGYSYNECECAYAEKRQIIDKRTIYLAKKYPKWKEHVLVYNDDGYTVKMSWEEQLRLAQDKTPVCKK